MNERVKQLKQSIDCVKRELKEHTDRVNSRCHSAMWNMEVYSSDPTESARTSDLRGELATLEAELADAERT